MKNILNQIRTKDVKMLLGSIIVTLWISACVQTNNQTAMTNLSRPKIVGETGAQALENYPISSITMTSELQILLPTSTPTITTQQVFTDIPGISFRFPTNWQVISFGDGNSNTNGKFDYQLRASNFVYFVEASTLSQDRESTLYYHTGHAFGDFFDTHVVWDKVVTIHDKDWHMWIEGDSGGRTWEGLEFLQAKGAITTGNINAIHYEKERVVYITLSRNLDRDMLIALDAQGAEAMIGEHLQQFIEILNSVTFTDSVEQNTPSVNGVNSSFLPTSSPQATPFAIESPLLVPTPTPTMTNRPLLTNAQGVSLQLPNDWQLIDAQKDRNPRGKWFVYELLPPTSLQFSQILEIGSLPREQESTLYLHTGEQTSLNQLEPEMHSPLEGFSPNLVVWDTSVTIREKDWHVRIQGESNALSIGGYTFEEQDQLAKKGSLTTGSIVAVHYEQTGEFYVRLSWNLDRDMLLALDAQGAEAMIAEHLQQFMEVLNSITFAQ